eukprot:NODE_6823_length_497_cov_31.372973_g6657_i0.p1 GENE.NODE_6823_length_497_cov_31.372973_g6657_i0~~NODE_6823_length_497_cov_31.372973_g6657_i0.p1  ORF type:complete len:128 (+),score=5.47 NODE_6823_length_497_cov_31.372973_g6657_i0:53-436(+)
MLRCFRYGCQAIRRIPVCLPTSHFTSPLSLSARQFSSQLGGPGIGPTGADMAAMFTCGACDTRVLKQFTKKSYTEGVVIVECPSCRNLHVLADNLGWFGEEPNIEVILKNKGEQVTHAKWDGQFLIV